MFPTSLTSRVSTTITLFSLLHLVASHMSIFTAGMYNMDYSAGNPQDPIGPNIDKVGDWFFRGAFQSAAVALSLDCAST